MKRRASVVVGLAAMLAACGASNGGGATTVVVTPASQEAAPASASPAGPDVPAGDKPMVVSVGETTIRYVVGSAEATAAILRGVRRARTSAVACYEGGAAKNRGLRGKMVVQVLLAPSGTIRSVRVEGSTLPDRDVSDCIVRAFRTSSFAELDGNCSGDVQVSEPLVFDPAP